MRIILKKQAVTNNNDISKIEITNLENFGLIEGYDIEEIGKRKAKKSELFDEIKNVDSKIQEKIQNNLEKNNYIVYGITKNKKIKGIYIFKEENDSLINTERIFTNEINDNIKNKYDKYLLKSYIELVANGIYNSVIIGDNILKPKQQKKKKISILNLFIGFTIGFINYIIFKNIFIALMVGLIIVLSTIEPAEAIISKKRKKEKK